MKKYTPYSDTVSGWAGWALVHPEFGSSEPGDQIMPFQIWKPNDIVAANLPKILPEIKEYVFTTINFFYVLELAVMDYFQSDYHFIFLKKKKVLIWTEIPIVYISYDANGL